MKYTLSVLLLGLLVLGYAEAPIYGYFWTRYTFENPTTPEVDENEHYFSIERGYIRWKTKTKPVSFKGTIDITSKKNATASTDWQIRLKYAQADWKLPGVGEYLPDAKLMIGLQKVYFGIVDLWGYPVIEKNLEETEKKMNSAELGVGFHSLLPGGYGEFSIQAFNGNGYSKVVEVNTNKAFVGNLSIIPIPGLMLKGSYWMAEQPSGDTIITQVDQQRYVGLAQFKYGPVTVIGEYLGTKDDEINGMGYMGFLELAVTKAVSVLGRYDYYDSDTDVDDNGHNRIIGGVNLKVSKHLLTQVNYQIKTFEEEDRDSEDKVMVQFKVSY
jgi:hypothetical protein